MEEEKVEQIEQTEEPKKKVDSVTIDPKLTASRKQALIDKINIGGK